MGRTVAHARIGTVVPIVRIHKNTKIFQDYRDFYKSNNESRQCLPMKVYWPVLTHSVSSILEMGLVRGSVDITIPPPKQVARSHRPGGTRLDLGDEISLVATLGGAL